MRPALAKTGLASTSLTWARIASAEISPAAEEPFLRAGLSVLSTLRMRPQNTRDNRFLSLLAVRHSPLVTFAPSAPMPQSIR
jgi:hypothetical protein